MGRLIPIKKLEMVHMNVKKELELMKISWAIIENEEDFE